MQGQLCNLILHKMAVTFATISFCYFKCNEEWNIVGTGLGKRYCWTAPAEQFQPWCWDWRIGSNRRHDQPLQIHYKIWMACSSYEKKDLSMKTFEKQCIYCRSTFKIVTNLICNPQFYCPQFEGFQICGNPIIFYIRSPLKLCH